MTSRRSDGEPTSRDSDCALPGVHMPASNVIGGNEQPQHAAYARFALAVAIAVAIVAIAVALFAFGAWVVR